MVLCGFLSLLLVLLFALFRTVETISIWFTACLFCELRCRIHAKCVPAHSPIIISGFNHFHRIFSQQLISDSSERFASAISDCCYCCFCCFFPSSSSIACVSFFVFVLICKPWHTCVCRDDRCFKLFFGKLCENVHIRTVNGFGITFRCSDTNKDEKK